MSGGGGGEDFDLWRGLQRIRRQTDAASLEDADRMRETDTRDEQRGRLWALGALVGSYTLIMMTAS